MIFAHKIALDLTQAQEAYCRKAAGTARFTYNWALAQWKTQYRNGEKPTAAKLKVQWNALKREQYPWVDEVHKDANQQPFPNLNTAFQKFFRHEAHYPTFKKKGQHDSFYISNDKCQVQGKRFRIPRLGWVRMREALRFEGKLMSAVVSRTADRWYVSLAVQLETSPTPCENQAGRVGVDLGVAHLATLSRGEQVDGPKPLKAALRTLRRMNRQLTRRVKGSANWYKTKAKLARLHARIAAIRTDALHKLTTTLARSCEQIVIEDLHVKGMVRNHRLARAISDMGLGTFRRMLTYKAEAYGAQVIVADRWFPSSKMCRVCGVLHDNLTLKDRVFLCEACGHTEDRDLHAAKNLQAYPGLQGNDHVCGLLSAGQTAQAPGETRQVEAETMKCAHVRTF
jgi:putative transposase